MQQKAQNNQAQETKQFQGFYANPQVYLNEERGTITHRLGSDLRIEMPVNLYKSILGLPFEKKEAQEQTATRNVFGLIARPVIYLKGDYLVHSVLGIRVSKHVNYYKKILSASGEQVEGENQALPA